MGCPLYSPSLPFEPLFPQVWAVETFLPREFQYTEGLRREERGSGRRPAPKPWAGGQTPASILRYGSWGPTYLLKQIWTEGTRVLHFLFLKYMKIKNGQMDHIKYWLLYVMTLLSPNDYGVKLVPFRILYYRPFPSDTTWIQKVG